MHNETYLQNLSATLLETIAHQIANYFLIKSSGHAFSGSSAWLLFWTEELLSYTQTTQCDDASIKTIREGFLLSVLHEHLSHSHRNA